MQQTTDIDAIEIAGRYLRENGYRFVTVTPASHSRVLARRPQAVAANLHDIFGWSLPFEEPGPLPPAIFQSLCSAGLVVQSGSLWRSEIRFSSLDGLLYAHSAFPTTAPDSVFFGPDTYRFCALIGQALEREPLHSGARILDVGCGAGPGGIFAAAHAGGSSELVLSDINARALRHAGVNARLAGCADALLVQGDLYAPLEGQFDLIVSNPPYLVDAEARRYRHGGGPLGSALSERIVLEGMERLAPGGRLVLYTGSAVVAGEDPFLAALQPALVRRGWAWHYSEIDPDVFGEELDQAVYAQADRIAAVALVVKRPA